jgi:hypothetical protein
MPDPHFTPDNNNDTSTEGDVVLRFTPNWSPSTMQFDTNPPGNEVTGENFSLISGNYQSGVMTLDLEITTHNDAWMQWSDGSGHTLRIDFIWNSGVHDISYTSSNF